MRPENLVLRSESRCHSYDVEMLEPTAQDKWALTNPPPYTIGNASILSSEMQETTSRSGFDIPIPLPGKAHQRHLQNLKPFERKYFLTFKGLRYLGDTRGSLRSNPVMKGMHNGNDVIVAVSCNQSTNDEMRRANSELGKGCHEDEERYSQYTFADLMNSTFCLVPAGRSPSSYRMIEALSAGAIPILICDNYLKPFDSIIQWHQCLLQFPSSEIHRILPTIRALSKEEVERRQKFCINVYDAYLKDDRTLLNTVITALKLRFYGVFPDFTMGLNGTTNELL